VPHIARSLKNRLGDIIHFAVKTLSIKAGDQFPSQAADDQEHDGRRLVDEERESPAERIDRRGFPAGSGLQAR
jgi:hypothetical protein